MDSHNCDRHVVGGIVKNEGNVEVGGFPPYPIAFRSIVPKREECSNLTVPVCISATHIAYGSIRMEPVFMVLGQSASIAACMAIDGKIPVQMVDVAKLQNLLKENPLLDGSVPEVLIDDFLHPDQITYTGSWKLGEGNISRYGKTVRLGEESPENKVKFSNTFEKAGTYNLFYYYPRNWDPVANVDSVAMTVFDGKSKVLKVIKVNEAAFHSNDNKGRWIGIGSFSLKPGAKAWVEVAGVRTSRALIPADAVLWVPAKKK
jgi:hypothetical protein